MNFCLQVAAALELLELPSLVLCMFRQLKMVQQEYLGNCCAAKESMWSILDKQVGVPSAGALQLYRPEVLAVRPNWKGRVNALCQSCKSVCTVVVVSDWHESGAQTMYHVQLICDLI